VVRDAKARADLEDNFRKTIGQLLGGAAVLLGAALAYLQFTQQQQNSRQQFIQQQQASHDLLVSNQVSKGFEQLGNEKSLVVRLGGIYALEGVMNTSDEYHQPVVEALCAFVRDSTRTETGDEPPTTDIQGALTVLGRRKLDYQFDLIDLYGAHIPKVNLTRARFRFARLNTGDLRRALLPDADLSYALVIETDLRGTVFLDTNLSHANLTGADLQGAQITQAQLDQACGT
jgi:uncharacterized protein YjbI with pentapeptide repeats